MFNHTLLLESLLRKKRWWKGQLRGQGGDDDIETYTSDQLPTKYYMSGLRRNGSILYSLCMDLAG